LSGRYSRERDRLLGTRQDNDAVEGHMFAYLTDERLLGFDGGDWALLLGSFTFIGLLTVLAV